MDLLPTRLARHVPLLVQLGTFIAVGATAFVAHVLVLGTLVETDVLGPVAASMIGFVVGTLVTYTLNSRFTFRSTRSHAGAIPRYFLVAGVAFILNGVLMDLFTHRLGLFYVLAQVLTSALVLCWTFNSYRLWAFAERRRAG
ncbi:GtrA family protein [Aquabacter spiritensis]|uniref:Putative flippase GtrA n=1 Tax=Aquabacter spiritensis TaxID=933073 RepID=A0A4R3M0P1_9HYPH|nr:GtrA family protein [Aquabacter spiritensis]TCT04655.1 putative flippase GtrA [Aquabacter spiritensis]